MKVSELSARAMIWFCVIATIVMEGITAAMRFGLGLQTSVYTANNIGRLTMGIRIHHGYFGVLAIVLAGVFWRRFPAACSWLLPLGGALVLSDLIHHYIVLWIFVGDPQFDLVYPR
ncbi:MAG: hypothetical protein ACOC54_02565 [Candidatus Sumerlaeota bacterium]